METIVKDKKTYKIHFLKTDQFKNVQIHISFRNKIKKEEITIRNFLLSMLTYSTYTYKTKRELMIREQELYGTSISSRNLRLGNYMISTFLLSTLQEKYTEENQIEECIDLLREVIFNPNVNKLSFDKESFKIVKENMETEIKSFKEDTGKYSLARMLEVMGEDEVYSYRTIGYLEDLEKITEENLYTYYKKFIQDNIVDIYVIGTFDEKKMEKLIEDNFKFYKLNKEIDALLPIKKTKGKTNTVIEEDDLAQSKLSIGCRYKELSDFDFKYTLTLYNLIFGVSTDSKLFRVVREENSLAYYIYSRLNKLDHLLLILSGIQASNFDKTIKLVKEQMQDMRKGKFSDEDIEKATTFFISALEQLEDNEYELVENYISMQILGTDPIDIRKKKIKEVTKEDIIRIAKEIKIDTIYLLKGGNTVEED